MPGFYTPQHRVSLVIFWVASEFLRHRTRFFSCIDNPKIMTKSEAKRAHLTGLGCDQNLNELWPIVFWQENIYGNYCETWEHRIFQSEGFIRGL